MPRAMNRRKFVAGTTAAAVAASFPLPAIAQNAPMKIGLLTVKTGPLAAGGIHAEEGITAFLEGQELHAVRPQDRIVGRRHRRQPGRRQDQGAGTGRARQGQHRAWPVRSLRAACDPRLSRAGQDADAGLRRRRGRHPAQGQRLSHAHVLHLGAVPLSARRLRRQGNEAQDRRPPSPTTSPSATSRSAASSTCSKKTAAASSRSCGRRSTRRTTRPISRRLPTAT